MTTAAAPSIADRIAGVISDEPPKEQPKPAAKPAAKAAPAKAAPVAEEPEAEVTESEGEPEAVEEEAAEPEAEKSESADGAETEEGEPAEEAEVEEPAAEEGDEVKEPETESPSTLRAIAEKVGMDYTKLLEDVLVETNIDGEEGTAPLSKVLRAFQLDSSIDRKSKEHMEERRQFEANRQKQGEEFNGALQNLTQMAQIAEELLTGDFKGVNWQTLERDNPQEYASLRLKLADRQQRMGELANFLAEQSQKNQQQAQERHKEYVKSEAKALANSLPTWKDPKVASAERAQMRGYLKSVGFDDKEADTVFDHRLILVLRDAMRYQALVNAKSQIKKRIATAPKLVRSGTPPAKGEREDKQYQNDRQTLRKTGKGAARLLERLL